MVQYWGGYATTLCYLNTLVNIIQILRVNILIMRVVVRG